MICPCGSTKNFDQCCEPLLKGEKLPESAEQLMRSRYSAFTQVDVGYIKRTIAPESRKGFDSDSIRESAQSAKWKSLKILNTHLGTASDSEGVVEFVATYEHAGEGIEHHEISRFRKDEDGQWLYVDGEAHTHKEGEGHTHHPVPETVVRSAPKVGRNDVCPCGSGKKYKKCCGTAA